jgi:hypothetical protein
MFHGIGWLVQVTPVAVFPERRLQPPENFHRDVRLESDMFGEVIVGVVSGRLPLFVKFAVKLVPAWRKRIEPPHPLEINEVVRLLSILKRILRGTSPAVRLGAKVGEFRNRPPQKSRHLSWDSFRSNAVDPFVSFVTPTENTHALEPEQCDEHAASQLASEYASFQFQ